MRKKRRKVIGVIAGILFAAWLVRVIWLTNEWEKKFPIVDIPMMEIVEQRGLTFCLNDYYETSRDELEDIFGSVAPEYKEMYSYLRDDDEEARFLLVTYHIANPTDETIFYPVFDIVMAGDFWATACSYPYYLIVNGDDPKSFKTIEAYTEIDYHCVYVISRDWEAKYLDFGYDGALVRWVLDPEIEIRDGRISG